MSNLKEQWVIEFRSGTFFQNLEAVHGGPKETAQKFDSKQEAEEFMRQHEWISFNGGTALPLEEKKYDINEQLNLVSFKCEMRRDWERLDAAKRLGYLCKPRKIMPGQIWFHPKRKLLFLIKTVYNDSIGSVAGDDPSGEVVDSIVKPEELTEENGWIPITWIDPRVYGDEYEFKKMMDGKYD